MVCCWCPIWSEETFVQEKPRDTQEAQKVTRFTWPISKVTHGINNHWEEKPLCGAAHVLRREVQRRSFCNLSFVLGMAGDTAALVHLCFPVSSRSDSIAWSSYISVELSRSAISALSGVSRHLFSPLRKSHKRCVS